MRATGEHRIEGDMNFSPYVLLVLSLGNVSHSFRCIEHRDRRLTTRFGTPSQFEDRFSRWRFLQQVLDEESDKHQTNFILGHVLRNYLYTSGDAAAPEHTQKRISAVQAVTNLALPDGSIPVLPHCDSVLFDMLQSTLPDPQEEEEAYKSNWDMVMEIHGREAVKVDEQAGEASWKTCCLVARVLLFYDFLTSD